MSRSKDTETLETVGPDGTKQRWRILERVVDRATNCIKRELVPVDTDEEDIPLGGRLLDERETEGHLARSSEPDVINVGDNVRLKFEAGYVPSEAENIKGTVEARLKNDRFRVRWENGKVDRYDAKDLARIW